MKKKIKIRKRKKIEYCIVVLYDISPTAVDINKYSWFFLYTVTI